MCQLNIAFRKTISHNNKEVFELIKTKTNKYMLIDCKTKKILATNKKDILKEIKRYGE